jgi:predicted amidophosphoribosyltransferase
MKLARLGESVECTSDLTGLRVLLIDDILTTGLTAARCMEALKDASASDVFVAVLGWTVSENDSGFKRRWR